jgi:hypothetical protein
VKEREKNNKKKRKEMSTSNKPPYIRPYSPLLVEENSAMHPIT